MNVRTFGSAGGRLCRQVYRWACKALACKRRVAAVLALLVIALALPSTASASAQTLRMRGLGASAGFNLVYPDDPCIQATLYVSAAETLTKDGPGQPVGGPGMGVFYGRTNTCTGEFLGVFAGVPLSPGAFQIDKKLNTATLNVSTTVCDMLGPGTNCVALDVHLTWTGTGEIARNKEFYFSDDGQCKYHYRTFGSTRAAEVAGSAIADGVEFATGTLFTAQLGSTKDGTVKIDCPF